jgi:hypothetical protein
VALFILVNVLGKAVEDEGRLQWLHNYWNRWKAKGIEPAGFIMVRPIITAFAAIGGEMSPKIPARV